MASTRSAAVLLLAAVLGGCASAPPPRPAQGPPAGLPAVTIAPESAPGFGAAPDPRDASRRDASLTPRPGATALEQSAWLAAARPSLARERQVSLSTSPGRYTYFRPERRRARD